MYIYKFTSKYHIRLPYPRIGERHGQETFLAPSADKQIYREKERERERERKITKKVLRNLLQKFFKTSY